MDMEDYFKVAFQQTQSCKDIESINVNIIRILEMLSLEEPDYQEMTEIMKQILGLINC